MSADILSGSGLQSGFVLAIIIGAVLLGNYLGGSAGLAQRIAQVALGLTLLMLVFSATAAFHGPPAISLADLEPSLGSEQEFMKLSAESSQRNSEVGTIHVGLGIIFVALGVVMFRRLRTITPAALLGGVLLILLGASTEGVGLDIANSLGSLLSAIVPGILGDAGSARDIARFVVLLVGAVLLTGLIYFRWERGDSGDAAKGSDS